MLTLKSGHIEAALTGVDNALKGILMPSEFVSGAARQRLLPAPSPAWPVVFILRWTLILLAAMGLSSCERDGALLPESQYRVALVGDWQGTVESEQESISFLADGKFVCQLVPTGFIGGTLGRGVTGKIRGTWELQGQLISLAIDSDSDVRPQNLATTSTIVSFHQNRLAMKSDAGETAIFLRAL
jgi:hypothetical protein